MMSKSRAADLRINFNFYADGQFEQLFNDLIATEEANGNVNGVNALRSQIAHYKATYKKFHKVWEWNQWQQINGDMEFLRIFLTEKMKTELPSKSELLEFDTNALGQSLSDILGDDMIFEHRKGIHQLCTTLSLRVVTKQKMDKFRMASHEQAIHFYMERMIALMENSERVNESYIRKHIPEYTTPESHKWYKLKMVMEETEEKSEDVNVVILVQCQVTVMRYLFLMLYKFDEDEAAKWMHDYAEFIEGKLEGTGSLQFECADPSHQHLELDILQKKLISSKGRGVCTYGGVHANRPIEQDLKNWRNRQNDANGREPEGMCMVDRFSRLSINGRPRGMADNSSRNIRSDPPRRRIRKTGHIIKWHQEVCNERTLASICCFAIHVVFNILFATQRGFGWISWDGRYENNCFLHQSELPVSDGQPLPIGTKVEFDIVDGGRGRIKAINVSVVERQPPRPPMRSAMNPSHSWAPPGLRGRPRLEPPHRASNSRFANLF